MAKPLTAKRYKHPPYVGWAPFHDRRIVVFALEWLGDVETTSGPMSRVKLSRRIELADPSTDIAVLVGKVPVRTSCGKQHDMAPDLFNWVHPTHGDTYWVKAIDGAGVEWCKQKSYLFYRVDIDIPDGFLENLTAERERYELMNRER